MVIVVVIIVKLGPEDDEGVYLTRAHHNLAVVVWFLDWAKKKRRTDLKFTGDHVIKLYKRGLSH